MNRLKIKVSTKVAIKNIRLGCRLLEKAIATNDVKTMEVGLIAISNGVAVFQIVEQQEKQRRVLNKVQ